MQQRELFEHVRNQDARREAIAAAGRTGSPTQPIPVKSGQRLENIQASPDGRYLTFRVRDPATDRPNTQYIDYVHESGYSAVGTHEPRPVSHETWLPWASSVSTQRYRPIPYM